MNSGLRTVLGGLLPLLGLLLAGCERPSRVEAVEASPEGVATVGGRLVTRERLEAELARVGRGGGPDQVRRALDALVEREQRVARALQLGLDRDPVVQRAWESALIARLEDRELEPALRAGAPAGEDSPLPAAERSPAGSRPDQVRLAVLRLDLHAKASAEKRRRQEARLEEARARVAGLPPGAVGFGGLAFEYSDDASTRMNGGDLGWMDADPARYRLDAGVMAAGLALRAPGEVSPVVQGKDGLYLVRLIARRAAGDRPGAAERDEALARQVRHLERRRSVEAAFRDEIRRTIPVTINTSLVARIEAERRPVAEVPGEPVLPL